MIENTILNFVSNYGYFAIFGVLIFGIIGVPVPDEVLMSFAGFLVSEGRLHYLPTVSISIIGSFTGMSISFFIGYRFGLPLLEKYGRKIHVTPERLKKVEHWFNRFGKFAVTIGYFIPGVRHFTAYFAGISRWNYRTFAFYAIPGAILWVLTFVSLGFYLEAYWRAFIQTLHRYTSIFVIAVLLGFVIWRVTRSLIKKQVKAR